MDSFYSRNRNPIVLVVLVFVQVIGLATQEKRKDPNQPNGDQVRLLRVWVIEALAPPERLFVRVGGGVRSLWHGYVALHKTNRENAELQQEVNELRAERVRLSQEAQRTQDLERLFGFKEQYVAKTVAAQVIGSSGTDASHVLVIDKGERNGLRPEMAVMTPDGIVGKVREVYPTSAQVLLLNDQQSGVGVMLEKSRRQGVMKGSVSGILQVHYVMSDEKVEPGEKVYTSGGDRIFPKGLEVGEVTGSAPDKERDGFQLIAVRPNANLFRLEEVLVVTQMDERVPETSVASDNPQQTNAEMLAARLPGIDPKAIETEPKVNAEGKLITPPQVKPAKAIAPDRFSPPGEYGGGVSSKATPTVSKVVSGQAAGASARANTKSPLSNSIEAADLSHPSRKQRAQDGVPDAETASAGAGPRTQDGAPRSGQVLLKTKKPKQQAEQQVIWLLKPKPEPKAKTPEETPKVEPQPQQPQARR